MTILTNEFINEIFLHPEESSSIQVVLHRAVGVVEFDGGIGVHSLLQAQKRIVHTVHLSHREVHARYRLVSDRLPQLLPVRSHLLAVAAPRGVELDKGVAFPVEMSCQDIGIVPVQQCSAVYSTLLSYQSFYHSLS